LASSSLTEKRDYDDVCTTVGRARRKRAALLKLGRANEAKAVAEMAETLVKATLARLEQRRLFLVHHTQCVVLINQLGDQIVELEALFSDAGFETVDFVSPNTTERKRLEDETLRLEMAALKLPGKRQAAQVSGSSVLGSVLAVLLILSLGIGLGLKELFAPPPPAAPPGVVYTTVPMITLNNITLTGDLNTTQLTALVASLPGMASIVAVVVTDYPVFTTLTLTGPSAPLSTVAALQVRDSSARVLGASAAGCRLRTRARGGDPRQQSRKGC
jgi:hypothetical protein